MFEKSEIDIGFDEVAQGYYAIWGPLAIGTGNTKYDALRDLRQAAHFGIDTFIDSKLNDIDEEKEG